MITLTVLILFFHPVTVKYIMGNHHIIDMKLIFPLLIIFLCFSSCGEKEAPPNVIYILADDLGYGELGVYGQEIIETPQIDVLSPSRQFKKAAAA